MNYTDQNNEIVGAPDAPVSGGMDLSQEDMMGDLDQMMSKIKGK